MPARIGSGVKSASILLLLASLCQAAPPPPTHMDESLVPAYTLPDPLRFPDGTVVASPADWFERRRPQILAEFTEQMFGKAPPAPNGSNSKSCRGTIMRSMTLPSARKSRSCWPNSRSRSR